MKNIKIDGLQFEIFLSSSEITKRVVELATVLKNVYNNKWPVFLVVLNGGRSFAHELSHFVKNEFPRKMFLRKIQIHVKILFLKELIL